MTTSSSGIQKEGPSCFSERNVPLNVQSFVPFPLSQNQQLYLQQQQQQHEQIRQNKIRMSQLNLGKEVITHNPLTNEYSVQNDEEDVYYNLFAFLSHLLNKKKLSNLSSLKNNNYIF
jgi:hypothetical protein